MSNNHVVDIENIKVHFDIKRSLAQDIISKKKIILKAVDGISFSIAKGEILSLVGESGSGKTTTGKAILQLAPLTEGSVNFLGEEVRGNDKVYMKEFRQNAQMIFQDPYQSVNPRNIVMDIVAEPLDVHGLVKTEAEREERVRHALEQAGMNPAEDYLYRYPHELSGGQRQRVVLASSMILEPKFVVADEPVSMLDASIRTGILKLLLELREKKALSYLFITHDLSLAWLISDRIAIMYLGKIMEIGKPDLIIHKGIHPYTRALTAIMPKPGIGRKEGRRILPGETPSPIEEINGCKFCTRCPIAKDICKEIEPLMEELESGHFVACHFAKEI
ncbi:oligopeptide/dipeptide ABC transporter ATP-binding protein [Gudongella sp. SC589]|jgi:oligopeptide/dipeptide ABC transporter ATP-binding protein|uniref:oligopeptide/dipeptide ABC transporter ATP-binding protein n=1 Tax=Gudongella sp. SC589 TaxID=3385990 RepID=UPI003904AA2D